MMIPMLMALIASNVVALSDTRCTNTVCINPAPTVEYFSFSPQYGRVSASINGVLFDSGLYAVAVNVEPQFDIDAMLFGPDDTVMTAHVTIKHWTARTSSGRGQMYVQHYELLSGTLTTP